MVSIWPFFQSAVLAIYYLVGNAWFVLMAAVQAILLGFEGYLEASEEAVVDPPSE